MKACSAIEAVARALSITGKGGQYVLGTGDWIKAGPDVPWTTREGLTGSDCAGFAICWAYKVTRHRPGYNVGPWSSVADDVNVNSAIEDAEHTRELFEIVTVPLPGDLLCYPTFSLIRGDGTSIKFIGHVGIVTGIDRVAEWNFTHPRYDLLDISQCKGPNGRKPGVIATDGSLFGHHDTIWPRDIHRTRMLRALP